MKNNQSCLKINNQKIEMTNCVKILGMNIDSKFNFDSHISDLCKKASMQLNALNRLCVYIGNKEMEILINSFIYSNLNYCPLVWHLASRFSPSKSIAKIDNMIIQVILNDKT